MKNTNTILTVIVIVLIVFFYLFIYKPSQVRKDCHFEALKSAVNLTNDPQYFTDNTIKRQLIQDELTQKSYAQCIQANGLSQ